MNDIPSFILLDDNPVTNMLSQLTIKKTLKAAETKTYRKAEKVFNYILTEFEKIKLKKTFLLIDINMPGMNCWEFLEKFENLPEEIKKRIRIYILSACYRPSDKELAAANKHVLDCFEKPLTSKIVNSLVGN